jgi:hypothetical protein
VIVFFLLGKYRDRIADIGKKPHFITVKIPWSGILLHCYMDSIIWDNKMEMKVKKWDIKEKSDLVV